MQKLLLVIAFLCCAITPLYLSPQNIAQNLQNFAVSLQQVTTFLKATQPTKPIQPDQPIKPDQPSGTPIPPLSEEMNFTKWKEKCDKLPNYDIAKDYTNETALTFDLFTKTLDEYFAAAKPILENSANWLSGTMPTNTIAWNTDNNTEESVPPFVPFLEKKDFKTTDIIAFHGDFHGDVHAFNNFIQTWVDAKYMDNNFKIIKDNFYIMILGDYTDRGWYGAEVIYTLLRIKLANPAQVFMTRGNHEDLEVIQNYGFANEELPQKFKPNQVTILLNKITRFYNFLPMAFYLICPSGNGNDVVQCCHGGIEIGYNPTRFLAANVRFVYVPTFARVNSYTNFLQNLSNLTQNQVQRFMQNDIIATTMNGFMWNDFIVDPSDTYNLIYKDGRGFMYSKKATEKILQEAWKSPKYTLRAIFRAHQHTKSDTDPMKQVILNFNKTRPDMPEKDKTAKWYDAPKADAGIAFLWSDDTLGRRAGDLQGISVLTFAVSPGNYYEWPYDAFGLLTLSEGYDNWNMKAYTAARNQYEKGKK